MSETKLSISKWINKEGAIPSLNYINC